MNREEIKRHLKMVYQGRAGIRKAVIEYMKEYDSSVTLKTDRDGVILSVENGMKNAKDLNLALSIVQPFTTAKAWVKCGFVLMMRFPKISDAVNLMRENDIKVKEG